jgi:hypothetical protein
MTMPKPIPLCKFEQEVKRLGLQPEQYEDSAELKAWVKAHVPVELLAAYGFATSWDLG